MKQMEGKKKKEPRNGSGEADGFINSRSSSGDTQDGRSPSTGRPEVNMGHDPQCEIGE